MSSRQEATISETHVEGKENQGGRSAGSPPAPAVCPPPDTNAGTSRSGAGSRKRALVEEPGAADTASHNGTLPSKRWRRASTTSLDTRVEEHGAPGAPTTLGSQQQAAAGASAPQHDAGLPQQPVPATAPLVAAEAALGSLRATQQAGSKAGDELQEARWPAAASDAEDLSGAGHDEGAAPEQGEAAELPDWCDKPLMAELPEGGEVDAFSYLPGHPTVALACEGQTKLLSKVLEMGANPDAIDPHGRTALHMACRHARLACVRCLLDAGAAQLCDHAGQTPAELAAAAGHDDVLAILQHHDAVQAALAEQRQLEGEQQAADGEEEALPCS